MHVVALTGGFGAGKSTVCRMLAERGALIVDADVLAREVVEPGTDGYREVVVAFGPQVIGPDRALDRAALAAVVFDDEEKRKLLESIIHPGVGRRIAERLEELRGTDSIVVLDIPLLIESRSGSRGVRGESEASRRSTDTGAPMTSAADPPSGWSLAHSILVVAASPETQLEHLREKGVSEDDARARIAAQAPLDEKLAVADHVIWNDGSMEELEKRVDEVWREILLAAEAPG